MNEQQFELALCIIALFWGWWIFNGSRSILKNRMEKIDSYINFCNNFSNRYCAINFIVEIIDSQIS